VVWGYCDQSTWVWTTLMMFLFWGVIVATQGPLLRTAAGPAPPAIQQSHGW